MLFINLMFICALTVYGIYLTYKNQSQLSCMDGMIIAMVIGGMSSVCLGMNLEVYLGSDLTLTTILSMMIGMIAGYCTGRYVSLMASLEGVMAGIMGGLMSPMLAAMLPNPMPMLWFLDIAFSVVMFLVISLMKEAEQAFLEENSKNT